MTRTFHEAAAADPYRPYLAAGRIERSRAVRAAFAALARMIVGAARPAGTAEDARRAERRAA